jgi:peptide chain release factor subunit 3
VQVSLGFVLSGPRNRCPVVSKFACQLKLLELLEHKSIFTAGYKSILHIHSITEECEVLQLDFEIDMKTKSKKRCKFVKSNASVICKIAVVKPICVEPFDVNPQMGRFTLRDEGKTIAIGKVTRLPPPGK